MPSTDESRIAPRWAALVEAGVVAGLVGGTLMALVAMIRAAAVGLGFWLPMKLVSGVYLGVDTLLGNGGVVLLGIVTHLVVASFWGAVFTLVTRGRLRFQVAFGTGLFYGAGVWLVMTYLVLPWADRTMFDRVNLSMGWFFFYHLLFGAALSLSPAMARSSKGSSRSSTDHRLPTPA